MTNPMSKPSIPLPPWWEEWGRRLEQELGRFEARGLPVTVLEDPRQGATRLLLETAVELPEGSTRIIVAYPDGFPHRRFLVFAPDLDLPRHQAPNGNLCLFPRDARYWQPQYMAADVVADDVARLVTLVREGGDTLRQQEDPQGEPITVYYGGTVQGGIIVDDRVLALDLADGDKGTLAVALADNDGRWLQAPPDPQPDDWIPPTGQGLLVQLRDAHGKDLLAPPPQALSAGYGPTYEGRWTYLANPPKAGSPKELWDAVMAADPVLAEWAETGPGGRLIGVCLHEEVTQDVYEPAWFFLTRDVTQTGPTRVQKRSGNPQKRHAPNLRPTAPQVVRALRWTETDLATRIPELKPLRKATVAVLGLGSLGAPVVQELTKSRIGTLVLADYDHIDPGTSVRYPLGLPYAGVDKALALGRWAQAHNPEVRVALSNVNVGAAFPDEAPPVSERERLHSLLEGADLLIAATAEHDVNRQLDGMAIRMGVPRLYLWSQSGYGGIVALLRAGHTGCFHCLSLYLSKRSQEGDHLVAVPPDVGGQAPGTVQGRGCGDKTFTATHADLLPLSIQAARVAYGFLCGSDPDGYPAFDDDVFAVQVREPDGKPIPPRWTALKLPPDPACSICHPA